MDPIQFSRYESSQKITKDFRETISRVCSLVHNRKGGHIIVPEPLNVEPDLVHGEPGLQEQVDRLVGEVLGRGQHLQNMSVVTDAYITSRNYV